MSFKEDYTEYQKLNILIGVLDKKLAEDQLTLRKNQDEYKKLYEEVNMEKADVEKLEKLSFTSILAKITQNFDKQYAKEYQEYINVKRVFDELNYFIQDVSANIDRRTTERHEAMEKKKELEIKIATYPEGKALKKEFEEKRTEYIKYHQELLEAYQAVSNTADITKKALDELDSAEYMEAYESLVNGETVTDSMKYAHIDNAQMYIRQIKSANNRMKKELDDLSVEESPEIKEIDASTRGFDMFFENMFTDTSVRNTVQDNLNTLQGYYSKLNRLLYHLKDQMELFEEKIDNYHFGDL